MAKKQNTSAPKASEKPADVLAPAVASAAAQATGDGAGEKLSELLAESMTVTSQIDGFRRGGIAWSRTPTTIALDDLSEEQIVAIAGEPMLDVVFNAAPTAD